MGDGHPRGAGPSGARRDRPGGRGGARRREQETRLKVAVDANVLVSAAIADGPSRRVLEVIADGAGELVLSEQVQAELRRVLSEQLARDDAVIEPGLTLLEELAHEPAKVPDRVEPVSGDLDDDRILAAAIAAGAEILIRGDKKHLLPLGRHTSIRVIRPQEFLAEIAR